MEDAKVLEDLFYHLVILYPQTYLITNIRLFEFDKYKTAKFCLNYISNLSFQEIEKFSNRDSVIVTNKNRPFSTEFAEFK